MEHWTAACSTPVCERPKTRSNARGITRHWFQYRDQATTGRGDGENYQIGFVDVCDKPYYEIVHAAAEIGEKMYQYRLGANKTE